MKKIDFKKIVVEAEKKRAELEAKHKSKVKLAVLAAGLDVEPCVCYFKTPTTFTKMQCRDLIYSSPTKAGVMLFEATVIREESDKRVFVNDNDEDHFYFGAIDWCLNEFKVANNIVKKK